MYKRPLICSLLSCFALESIKCELNKYVLQGLAIPADKVEAELELGPTMCKWQMSYFEANNFNSFSIKKGKSELMYSSNCNKNHRK